MSEPNKEGRPKKILFMGLDNGGKTSIVLSLQKNTNLLSYYSLKPTRGLNIVNIENHGSTFNIWDFGGQEEYRKNYLQHLDEYMKEIDKIIFVIDVQDIERYDIAVHYLGKIMGALVKNSITPSFSIFLHKFDPTIENLENFTDETVSKRLLAKIEKITPTNFEYELFKTCIYTVFQKRLF